MHPAIVQHRDAIAAICRRFGVRRLDVFGSAAHDVDFDPARSDADFLVEFAPGAVAGLQGFFGAKEALEQLLGRPVDLVEADAVRNPYVRASIDQSRQPVYAAAA
ncbi:nucleotidyltransferase family protein [Ottowia sp.]|uniref:nucleotidyltransferase family protein n=1 Tax=Ottowia sp. TaxID=1898956 RepID=UPI0039E61E90